MTQGQHQGLKVSSRRSLVILLGILFLASWMAARVQTAGGDIDVTSIKIPTQNGQWLVADLFKPRSASAADPVPFVVVVPGFQRSKEALSNVALELARRGFVTASIDPYAQGGSSASLSRRAATTEGYGLFALVDYAASTGNLDYIDPARIGATGHSAGGNAAIRAASHFGREARRAVVPSKLAAVYVSGYVLTLTDEVLDDVQSSVGVSYAYYDEGAFRNELRNGDMRVAPEALRAINSGLPEDSRITAVSLGAYYGSRNDRTLRVVHNERVLHPFQPYTVEATANLIEFFEAAFDMDSPLPSDDQVWMYKELLGVLSLIVALASLVPLGRLLLRTSWFNALAGTVPEPLPRPSGSGRAWFWATFVLGALVACFTYIPLAEVSQTLFKSASNRELTWFFPQRMNNAVMLWAVLNGVFGTLLFWLAYRFHGRGIGVTPGRLGIVTTRAELARTALLAAVLFAAFFLILFTIYYFFHVDYRFLFMGVRVFQPQLLLLLGMYLPFFLVFFLSSSLRTNATMHHEGQAEWRGVLMGGLSNSLGLMLIILIQYTTFAVTGTVYWTDGWLYVNLLFGVVPMMFALPWFHRHFFRMTGKIYLGPLVMCSIFVMILITNTVIYLPL